MTSGGSCRPGLIPYPILRMRLTPLMLAASVTLLLASCGPDVVFDQSYDVPEAHWTYADTLDFELEVTDTLAIFDLFLNLSHAVDFPNQNLYVQLYTQFPNQERMQKLVSLELADKAGDWYGRCGSEWCELSIPIQEDAFFNLPGAYRITLEQFSRTDTLAGIRRLGIQLIDTGKKRQVQTGESQ